MTTTARITMRWADRNGIGEPINLVRHSMAWDRIEPLASMIDKDYPFSTVVTEAELTIREVIQYCVVAVAGLGIAAVMVLGLVIKLYGRCFGGNGFPSQLCDFEMTNPTKCAEIF